MPAPLRLEMDQTTAVQIISGTDVVAGVATALNAAVALSCRAVTVQARSTNAGACWVGDSSVTAGTRGIRLAANDVLTITIDNVNKVFLIGTPGDNLDWVAVR